MPTISAIKLQKTKGRYNIYLNGKFGFGIDEDTLLQRTLKVGQELTSSELDTLINEGEIGQLYQKTLRFLTFRPRSEKEVFLYLSKKMRCFPSSSLIESDEKTGKKKTVEIIIQRLKEQKLVDDESFALWWVQQRRSSAKPRGIRLIRAELLGKGVNRDIIEKVLLNPTTYGEDETDELELAKQVAEKKLPSCKRLKPWEFRRKMGNLLQRRGFEFDTIKKVVDRLTPKE